MQSEGGLDFEQVVCYKCPKCDFVSRSVDTVASHYSQEHETATVSHEVGQEVDRPIGSPDTPSNEDRFDNPHNPPSEDDSQVTNDEAHIENWKCSIEKCAVRMSNRDNMHYHVKCHSASGFVCPECGEFSNHWVKMASHLWKCHTVDMEIPYCHVCPYKTAKKELLRFHLETHSQHRSCLCDQCGKGFKNMKQLRNHKKIHWVNDAEREKLTHACPDCGRVLKSARLLRAHRDAIHLKNQSSLCPICGYKTTSTSNLNIHQRTQHSNVKPLACKDCNYRTADHNSLRRHRMKHTGEKPYRCPFCSYASIQSSTFKAHMRKKHQHLSESIVFSCSTCSFRTVSRDKLELHTVSVHPDIVQSDRPS